MAHEPIEPRTHGSSNTAPAWAEEVLSVVDPAADPSSTRVHRLHDGVLSEVHDLRNAGNRWIVKLHRFDLSAAVSCDPDPRFAATARWLSLPPFFASTRDRVDALRARVTIELPRVVLERPLSCGPWCTVMLPIPGVRVAPAAPTSPPEKQRLSARMGQVLGQLHHGGLPGASPWADPREFIEDWAQAWHGLVDALPEQAAGDRAQRHGLHRRLNRLLESLRCDGIGPTVLMHGDFGPENLLWSTSGDLAGLLDFQLCCPAPAFLDLRWLHLLDRQTFLDAYGWPRERHGEASWLGHFAHLFWEALILVVLHRFATFPVPPAFMAATAKRFCAGLDQLEGEPLS